VLNVVPILKPELIEIRWYVTKSNRREEASGPRQTLSSLLWIRQGSIVIYNWPLPFPVPRFLWPLPSANQFCTGSIFNLVLVRPLLLVLARPISSTTASLDRHLSPPSTRIGPAWPLPTSFAADLQRRSHLGEQCFHSLCCDFYV